MIAPQLRFLVASLREEQIHGGANIVSIERDTGFEPATFSLGS